MYRIIHLPTAECVVDGNSRINKPELLYFDTIEEATEVLKTSYFKYYHGNSGTNMIIYCSSQQTGKKQLIPNYLFDLIEVLNV